MPYAAIHNSFIDFGFEYPRLIFIIDPPTATGYILSVCF